MTAIKLEKMSFFGYHGFYPEEQATGNHFEVSVYLNIPTFDSVDDNIEDTVNYELVHQMVKEEMTNKKYKLLETLALIISRDIKAKFPQILQIKTSITKLNPPGLKEVHSATVEHTL